VSWLPEPAPIEYVIELDVAARFLWRWSLYELLDAGADSPLALRSLTPAAAGRRPHLSRRAAVRAAERTARRVSEPSRAPTGARRILQLALVVLAAAVVAGALFETRDSSHHARHKPFRPPRTTHSATQPKRPSFSRRSAAQLNDEGYSKMRRGHYAGALPLLEEAVRRLRGSGSVNEAYADFNLASTRYHLGKCANVLALLERSQQIQGELTAIDNLRSAARKICR
jgi:hypothetical protein